MGGGAITVNSLVRRGLDLKDVLALALDSSVFST